MRLPRHLVFGAVVTLVMGAAITPGCKSRGSSADGSSTARAANWPQICEEIYPNWEEVISETLVESLAAGRSSAQIAEELARLYSEMRSTEAQQAASAGSAIDWKALPLPAGTPTFVANREPDAVCQLSLSADGGNGIRVAQKTADGTVRSYVVRADPEDIRNAQGGAGVGPAEGETAADGDG